MTRRPTDKGTAPGNVVRDLAFAVLTRVDRASENLSSALDEILFPVQGLSAAQRAMVAEIAYGTTRHRRLLDRVLTKRSRRSFKALHPGLKRAMRMAAYQLLLMENAHAALAVNHAVGMARKLVGKSGAGFVNAVLRRIAENPVLPDVTNDKERISIMESFPDWMTETMIRRLGMDEALQLAKALNKRPETHLRANRRKVSRDELIDHLSREGISARPGRWSPDAVSVQGLADPRRHSLYERGFYEVQDEASQLVAFALAASPGQSILDGCSGHGGKTMHLVSLGLDRGLLVSADKDPKKLSQARSRAAGSQARAQWLCMDLTNPALKPSSFDRVLLDAPCTGLGALRRHPEAKWRVRRESLRSAVELQRALLDSAAPLVRPGGSLLYVVCTFTEEEGPGQAQWFVDRHEEFEAVPLTGLLPDELLDKRGNLATWPHRHDMDGFFAARFTRRTSS